MIRTIGMIGLAWVLSNDSCSQGRWGSAWGGSAIHQFRSKYDITTSPSPLVGLRYGHDLGNNFRVLLGLEQEWTSTREELTFNYPYMTTRIREFESRNVNLGIMGAIRIRSSETQEWRFLIGGVSRMMMHVKFTESHSRLTYATIERTLTGSELGSSLQIRTGVRYARKLKGRAYGFVEAWGGRTLLITGNDYYAFGMGRGGAYIPIPIHSIGLIIGFEFGPPSIPLKKNGH